MSILGVKVDPVSIDQAADKVWEWLKSQKKHYLVTTNVEFIMLAQKDTEFKKIINGADLSIPDSSRLDWAWKMECEKGLKRIFLWPFFLLPNLLPRQIPTTTGVDLMERLCQLSQEKGFRVGLLGGKKGVAEKTGECLLRKYPGLKVSYAIAGGEVDECGNVIARSDNDEAISNKRDRFALLAMTECDILFVALGAPKQEKWIAKNIDKTPAKVFIGVGGALDYLSGEVSRAPSFLRALGLEWLFRLIIQPWRATRFKALWEFIFKI